MIFFKFLLKLKFVSEVNDNNIFDLISDDV